MRLHSGMNARTILTVLTFVAALTLGIASSQSNQPNANLELGPGPLTIPELRSRVYSGSAIRIASTLRAGSNYKRYIASYQSEGLKINGLLTVPNGTKPKNGWPAIVFVHGYIPPAQYRTTEKYVAYVDGFARAGYVVFKIDLRGHGSSEGVARGAYWAPDYTVDTLNAFASLRAFKDVNPDRVGMWGHSMGGYLTLRAMVIERDIRAGVIWGGVVGSYSDILERWRRRAPANIPQRYRQQREAILKEFGTPSSNPAFWNAVSSNSYLADGVSPIQLHHGQSDDVVPIEFSRILARQLKAAKQPHELLEYPRNDHNLSQSLRLAIQRSVVFFDRHLKR